MQTLQLSTQFLNIIYHINLNISYTNLTQKWLGLQKQKRSQKQDIYCEVYLNNKKIYNL